jgi:hypothetical protein
MAQKFQNLINEAAIKLQQYHAALKAAEKEYERRYGHHPSDVDNDAWIDAMHVTGYAIKVEELEQSIKLHTNHDDESDKSMCQSTL